MTDSRLCEVFISMQINVYIFYLHILLFLTDRVSSFGRYELTDDSIFLAEALVFVRLHRPHVLQVDCGQEKQRV